MIIMSWNVRDAAINHLDLSSCGLHILNMMEYLPEDIVAKITASPPPSLDQNEDTIGWKHTEDGDFSIGATYKGLEKWTKPQQNDWTKIWKWQGPQKAKTLIWRLLHDRLLTNQRKSHTFGGDDTCHSCRTQPEDTLHAFRNCPIASSTWMILIKPVAVQAFFRTNLKDWITLNLNNQLGTSPDTEWKDTFIITCWNLWNWRNRELHENSYQRPPNASREILKRVREIHQQACDRFRNWIEECCLIDLGYVGSKFTWVWTEYLRDLTIPLPTQLGPSPIACLSRA
ncbi:hypothetical protein Ahy_B04g068948 [Arachis hypogaea]|uniref:Reverse transcriptase zinc-binding domain-containing protein n=1 Tax=Arachis hypogaea TaxID=3818 RepID=A0A444ZB59_ARAHY|nr:hypothetical protein Ahy_B04g068948 [Arachis hypogaea]